MTAALRGLAAVAALTLAPGHAASAAGATTERVSVTSAGGQGDSNSFGPSLSGGGRLVAFGSGAGNLAPGTGGVGHVFLRDRAAGRTTVVDLAPSGRPADGFGSDPLISRDGRHVAFVSAAADLVPGDANHRGDVFVRDLAAGTTAIVSVGSSGRPTLSAFIFLDAISADGRYVAFSSDSRNITHQAAKVLEVFVRDTRRGRTTLESRGRGGEPADADAFDAALSGDGRFLAFASGATNLVPGDANGAQDVFLEDRATGRTVLVSRAADGAQGDRGSGQPAVSDDGTIVAFSSGAANLVPGPASGHGDAFVRDLRAGTTTRISDAPGGGPADGDTQVEGISADGRYVLLLSDATDLVPGDTNGAADVFVYDRRARTTTRADVGAGGAQARLGASDLEPPTISADGRVVGFASSSPDLVPGDTGGHLDAFVRVPGGAPARPR